MKTQNRPYSATDIHLNLHGAIAKPTVVKCLKTLEERGVVVCKTYSKQQVYLVKQVELESGAVADCDTNATMLRDLSQKETDLRNSIKLLTKGKYNIYLSHLLCG